MVFMSPSLPAVDVSEAGLGTLRALRSSDEDEAWAGG